MNSSFNYSNTFTLDKDYLTECYEESLLSKHSLKAYFRALSFILVAIILLTLSTVDTYIASFILIIGIIDAAAVYFHKPWWLARQALGSNYNSIITLTINEDSIVTQSFKSNLIIKWHDIKQIQQTEKGILIHNSKGRNYLSKNHLTQQALEFILSKTNDN